jgi:hypothetical protein
MRRNGGWPYALDDAPDLPIHPRCSCSNIIAARKGDDEEEEEAEVSF